MKKYAILALAFLAGSGSALAADRTVDIGAVGATIAVCNGTTADKVTYAGGSGAVVSLTDSFIKTGFVVQCSANSHVAVINASGTLYQVGSGSAKGNQSFKGSSNGGAVVVSLQCTGANNACTDANAASAAVAAVSM
jgi:hypothetical protein